MSSIAAVTEATFTSEVEEHKGLALVDFWAIWCGPCHAVAPILDQLARDYDGRIKVTKVDVDANQQLAMRWDVRSIPTVVFFKDGRRVDHIMGALPKSLFVEKIEKHLGQG
jgi:thioredoxin 1